MTVSIQQEISKERAASARPCASKTVLRPRMVVGVTSAQTCLVLAGRLKALREAGFAVTLVASPGEWLRSGQRLRAWRWRRLRCVGRWRQ